MTSDRPCHFDAIATRDGRWWLIEVPGIGATQSRNLAAAEDQVRDLVAAVLDVDIEDVTVHVLPDLGEDDTAAPQQRRTTGISLLGSSPTIN
ncbi:MAG TPA: hypothetical protein VH479_06350 [Acidimicrobiales bacterium]